MPTHSLDPLELARENARLKNLLETAKEEVGILEDQLSAASDRCEQWKAGILAGLQSVHETRSVMIIHNYHLDRIVHNVKKAIYPLELPDLPNEIVA